MKKLPDASVRGLLQGITPDRLRATTGNVRHNILWLSQMLVHSMLDIFACCMPTVDRLCGLVVRVSGYRYRGLGFDSRRYQIF